MEKGNKGKLEKECVMMLHLALILAIFFVPVAAGLPDEAVGRVVSVISGDSLGIEMLIADERTSSIDSIKLADIQAPSTVTAEGKAAQKYAYSLLKNKTVYLDINDNSTSGRNEWNQLICVIYLMDEQYRPIWPPVNRIIVDAGHARIDDDINNEFDFSAWWQEPPAFPPGKNRELLAARMQKQMHPSDRTVAGTSLQSSLMMGEAGQGRVLEKDSASGRISIGYRK